MSTVEHSANATAVPDTQSLADAFTNDAPPSASGRSGRSASPPTDMAAAPSLETNPQSQPMTATVSSSSSLQPTLDNGDSAASGYGTRSRNRTGGRPNYAEDKELDLEIEALSKPSRSSKRSGPTSDQQPATDGFMSVNGTAPPEKPVETMPATTSSPAAAPAPSKKRKHPGSNHTVATASTSASSSRTKHPMSIPFKGYVETNMLSFSRCGSKLNAKRQLVADDGTSIQANGNRPSHKKSFLTFD